MDEKDLTTENRIKEVARKKFQEKGYAATRTREIADEANVNIALLNYYFRSKEQLFNIIMLESIQEIFLILKDIINDRSSSLMTKAELAVNKYIDILVSNPHLPLFVLSEIRNNPETFIKKTQVPRNMIQKSFLFEQLQDQINKEGLQTSPIHIVLNIVSMSIMPIAARGLLGHMYDMTDEQYQVFIHERRTMIPIWIKDILRIKD